MSLSAMPNNIVVTASAGTGKTFRITQCAMKLILLDGMSVERIVALTFTEKAANEMKERLMSRLQTFYYGGKVVELGGFDMDGFAAESGIPFDTIKKRVKAALVGIEQMPICTIHSFAGRIIKMFPREARVHPAFEAAAEIPETLFEEEWQKWVRQNLASAKNRNLVGLIQLAGMGGLRELARGLCNFLVPLDKVIHDDESDEEIRSRANAALVQLRSFERKKQAVQFETLNVFDVMVRVLEAAAAGKEISADDRKRGWMMEIQGHKKIFGQNSDPVSAIQDFVKQLMKTDGRFIRLSCEPLVQFGMAMRERMRRDGILTFDALLVIAAELLRKHRHIRSWCKKAYDAILVDEFQDTDPIQYEIILFLCEKEDQFAADALETKLKNGKLLVVGDPKQSIYSFRGANLDAYERVVKHIIDDGAGTEPLKTSRRSKKFIIESVNMIFGSLFVRKPGLQPEYQELDTDDGTPGKIEALTLRPAKDEKPSADDARKFEAAEIAKWVRARIADGIQPHEIAILLRAMGESHYYAAHLRALKIPVLIEGEKSFFETQEVADILNFLRVIVNPYDEAATIGILRSPWGALTDEEIFQMKQDARSRGQDILTYMNSDEPQILKSLRELRDRSAELEKTRFLECMYDQLEIPAILAATAAGEQAVANAQNIIAMSRSHKGSLAEFVRYIARLESEGEERAEALLADPTTPAVRIMSMHKSKGLEFRCVVLPDLSRGKPGNTNDDMIRYDWVSGRAAISIKGIQNSSAVLFGERDDAIRKYEAVRLLYVAMTRARERLLLSAFDSGRNGSSYSALKSVAEFEAIVESRAVEIQMPPPIPAVPEREKIQIPKVEEIDFGRFLNPRVIKPSSMHDFERAKSDEHSNETAAQVGTLCHAALEVNEEFSVEFIHQSLRIAAASTGIYDEDIHARSENLLKKFLKSTAAGELRSGKILGREVPFLFMRDGQLVTGIIDVIYESDRKIVVGDYKTDDIKALQAKPRAKVYRAQGELYLEACRRRFPGKPISFRLIFLAPCVSVGISLAPNGRIEKNRQI